MCPPGVLLSFKKGGMAPKVISKKCGFYWRTEPRAQAEHLEEEGSGRPLWVPGFLVPLAHTVLEIRKGHSVLA